MKNIFLSFFILIALTSCRGIDRLEYDKNMPLLTHSMKNGCILVGLPYPVLLTSPAKDNFYTNNIRTERIGTPYVNDFDYPLSSISIFNNLLYEQKKYDSISLGYYARQNYSFALFRDLLLIVNNKPVRINFRSSTEDYGFSKEINEKIASEDNELFLRIIDTVRLKDEKGKWFKVVVDKNEYYKNISLLFTRNEQMLEADFPVKLVELEKPPELISDWNSILTVKIKHDKERAGGLLYYVGDKPMTKNLDEVPALCRKAMNVPESAKVSINIDSVVIYDNELDSRIREVLSKGNIEVKHILVSYIDYMFQRYEEFKKQKPAPQPAPDDRK